MSTRIGFWLVLWTRTDSTKTLAWAGWTFNDHQLDRHAREETIDLPRRQMIQRSVGSGHSAFREKQVFCRVSRAP
jgi:hypothetical protein